MRTTYLVIAAAVVSGCGGARETKKAPAPVARSTGAPGPSSAEGPATLAGVADRGSFVLYVQDTPLATIEYALGADGSYAGRSTLTYAGQSVEQRFRVAVDPQGRWTELEADAPTGKSTVVRDGLKLRIQTRDGTRTMEIKPDVVLFENFSPALMNHVLRRYDRTAGGDQQVWFYVPGAPLVEGKIRRQEPVTRSVRGLDQTFERWHLAIPDVEIDVLADQEGKVVFARVPAQDAAYVRGGYEGLLAREHDDPKLSRPEHEVVVDDEVRVKMRDGVELAVDVYRPAGQGKHPTIVVRTPYKKELGELQGRYFARRGYAYAVQDVRGRFASGGQWIPFVNERTDGYDTIEWAARQPWSTGKVGMIGASYLGWVQWLAAAERPPHLVTIIPNVAPPDPFYNVPYEHGVFFLLGAVWWADVVSSEATADMSGVSFQKIGDKKYSKLLRSLPVVELDKVVLGGENKHWREWLAHPTNDSYWAGASYLGRLDKVKLPVFIQSGWFDGDGIGSKLAYAGLARLGRKNVKLILGPWGHTDTAGRRIGDRDFGPEAIAIDLQREYLRWFDRWLKGIDNGIDREPLVSIFAMGSNRWLKGQRYPIEGTKLEKWHLGSAGGANGLGGDGKLGREVGGGGTADSDTYIYDPGDPTPDPNYYEAPERKKEEVLATDRLKEEAEGWHHKVLSSRKDILVYASEPFTEETTFAGPISAVLYAATTAKDTDWFVSLVLVDQQGKPFSLAQGRLRARFRASSSRPTLLAPGRVEKYELDLWQTGITVKKGERLRVEIASAAFPVWSRNLNTGGHNETETAFVSATQTIHHSKRYPSHILLPRTPAPK